MNKTRMDKEQYFTDQTIDQVAQAFLKKIHPMIRHHSIDLNPKKTALCVVDMQNYFLNSNAHAFIPSAKAIIPKIKRLQDLFFQHNLCVIHTRHGNTSENAGSMAKWWGKLLDRNSTEAQITETLSNDQALLIDKTQYDAFYGTQLDTILKKRNISQLIITGVMTHLCAETTARSAFMQSYDVYFAVDGTATYRHELHLASLMNLSHGFAVPVLIKSIEEKFQYAK